MPNSFGMAAPSSASSTGGSYLSGNQGNDMFVGNRSIVSAADSATSTLPGAQSGSVGASILARQSSVRDTQNAEFQALQDRRAGAAQVVDTAYQTHKQFNDARAHQGGIGRFVESAANAFNVKGSPKNVEKKMKEVDADSRKILDSVGDLNGPGKNFNDDYKLMTGFDYDASRPTVEEDDDRLVDGKFGGKLGEGQQAFEDYVKSQQKGMLAFSIITGVAAGALTLFCPVGLIAGVAIGAATGIATSVGTMAIEDNTRGDGQHDFNAGNYLSAAGTGALAGLGGGLVGAAGARLAMVGAKAGTEAGTKGVLGVTRAGAGETTGNIGGGMAGGSLPLPAAKGLADAVIA